MVLLLHSGRCYEAEICVILFLLRCPFILYPFWPKSKFSVFSQKPWTIIRRFDRNRGHFLWSFYSTVEGAMKLKFAPFWHVSAPLELHSCFSFFFSLPSVHSGEAILSGSLSWRSVSEYGRTAARLTLTLTLLHSSTPNASVGGVTSLPGTLAFGDGTFASEDLEETELKVLAVDAESGYVVAEGSIVHVYPSANRYGNPWWAELRYCCRGKSLLNNRGTM